jgi:predicted ester cyclase
MPLTKSKNEKGERVSYLWHPFYIIESCAIIFIILHFKEGLTMHDIKQIIGVVFSVFIIFMLIGCGKQNAEKLKNDIRQLWVEEAWNKGNLNALDGFFASNYVYHNIPFPDMNSLDAYKQYITQNRTAYPDIKITLEDVIVEGDKVVAHGTYQGTQKGLSPTMGITTGKPVNFRWCTVSRMENGKYVESWAYVDYLGLRQQIGYTMLPPITETTFARVTITQSNLDKAEEAIKIYKENLVPEAKRQKGFHFIMSLSDFKTGKGLSISIWDSEADAIANEQSGYYNKQVDRFKAFYIAKPVREGYTVTVQE